MRGIYGYLYEVIKKRLTCSAKMEGASHKSRIHSLNFAKAACSSISNGAKNPKKKRQKKREGEGRKEKGSKNIKQRITTTTTIIITI